MVRIIAGLILLFTIVVYGTLREKKQVDEVSSLNYVSIDTSLLTYKRQVYVPVNLYQKLRQGQKILLKVRNASFTDSIYLSRLDYYDSEGALLSTILDSTLLIKPMATSEITIRNKEFKKNGDNLIVQWYSKTVSKPVVQAIVIDSRNCVVLKEEGIELPGELTTIK